MLFYVLHDKTGTFENLTTSVSLGSKIYMDERTCTFNEHQANLDVSKHFALGELSSLLLLRRQGAISMFKCFRCLGTVFKLSSTLVQKQQTEGTGTVWWFKVWSFLRQPLAQLCVHRTVFGLIKGFFKDLQHKKDACNSMNKERGS